MNLISRNNPRIKQARLLKQRKHREQMGLFLVEGIRHVGEAAQSGAKIETLIFAPNRLTSLFAHQLIQDLQNQGVECLPVADDLFDNLAEKDNPQGILAVVHQPQANLESLDPEHCPWVVALVSPQDPGNVGAILRTMDAVGASALLLLEDSVDPHHHASVRASMGSLFWLPVVQASFADFSQWSRHHGYVVYGTSAHGSVDYHEINHYQAPLVLLLGSERQGLTPDQAALCKYLIRLPMAGRVTSLNLAVAAGIMLYAIREKLHPNFFGVN
jgi:TrmH family RNA methyltransferase